MAELPRSLEGKKEKGDSRMAEGDGMTRRHSVAKKATVHHNTNAKQRSHKEEDGVSREDGEEAGSESEEISDEETSDDEDKPPPGCDHEALILRTLH